MGATLFVDRSESDIIDELRMQEYAKASGFAVDLSTLKWKDSDDESHVMAVEMDQKLVATMRGEIITSQELLEKKLECPWSFPLKLEFPILLLSRAATLSDYRQEGLNLLQRYWFLKMARHYYVPFVLGTFVSGSPRENTLKEMGYDFFENTLGWQQSTYRSLRPVQVVALDMKQNGGRAIKYCEEKMGDKIETLSLKSYPELKTVTRL